MKAPCVLELQDVSKSFGRNRVLNDVSLCVHAGEILGVIGANGVGKTTLLRILAGLVRADRGTVRRARVSRAEDVVAYFAGGASVSPNLTTGRLLGMFGAEVPAHLASGQRVSRLSRGARQQVGLLAVLAREPTRLWVLDEPWDGLDPVAAARVRRTVGVHARRGGSVIIASHRLHELVGLATQFAALVRGALYPLPVFPREGDHDAVVSQLMEALQ